MADIFISYKKTDYAKVAPIKTLLEAQGWSVWIDTRLEAGDLWDAMIERELEAARCVVVVWTEDSIKSRWVRTEANEGLDRNILVPVTMGAKQPLAFKLVQFADLLDWDGDDASPRAQTLISGVRAVLGKSAPPPQAAVTPPVDKAERDWERFAIGETADVETIQAYIGDYENTARLWAVKAKKRLGMVDALWLQRAEEAAENERLRREADQKLYELAKAENLRRAEAERREKEWAERQRPAEARGNPLAAGGYEDKEKRLIRTLEGHGSDVHAVAVSADGKTVVSGSGGGIIVNDKTVKLWNAGTGKLIRTLEGHGYEVRAVAVTGNGKTIVSGSFDKTVKLWDVSEWTQA